MPKKTKSAETRAKEKNLRSQLAANKLKMQQISDKLVAEKRGMTDEETTEMENLRTANQQISVQLDVLEAPDYEPVQERADRELATSEILTSMRSMRGLPDKYGYLRAAEDPNCMIIPASDAEASRILQRDGGNNVPVIQSLNTVTPVVPITMQDIIEPLSHLLIYDKVGLRIQHGIEGQWNFPVVSGVEATFLGENVEITDSKLDFSAITPAPKRYSISIPVSNLAMIQAVGLRSIIINAMSTGVANLINKVTFSTTQVGQAATFPTGPFVGCDNINAAATKITYAEAVALKYAVIGKGVLGAEFGCYVCTPETYAELATTPRDAGSGLMVLQDGKIDGTPVFYTTDFDANKLGFGIFSYDVCGFFGQQSLGFDSTSKDAMKQGMTWFVLNGYMDLKALRTEAFAYITKHQ